MDSWIALAIIGAGVSAVLLVAGTVFDLIELVLDRLYPEDAADVEETLL